MCINKRFINSKYVHYPILVKCGSCPSCQQEKAINRANRIRSNMDSRNIHDRVCVFITLTYTNDFVPYILKSELQSAPVHLTSLHKNESCFDLDMVSSDEADIKRYCNINVYRNCFGRKVRVTCPKGSKVKYKTTFKKVYNKHTLCSVRVPDGFQRTKFKSLVRFGNSDAVGVCYFQDLQNFQKRLRIILQRKFKKLGLDYDSLNYSFYQCSEYGPTTGRPHFHCLCFISRRYYDIFKAAVVTAWPYADRHRTLKNIEIARDAAGYVSSYVNSDSYVPKIFKDVHAFKASHSYSQGFGTCLLDFTFLEVCKKIEQRNLRCNMSRYVNGAFVVVPCLLPKYVINRYFPKIKGYSRLTFDEIQSICYNPRLLETFKERLDYSELDLRTNIVRLENKLKLCLSFEDPLSPGESRYSIGDYAYFYASVWSIYNSNILEDFYNSLDCPTSNFYAYDNVADFYEGSVLSPSLESVIPDLPTTFIPIYDCNAFPDNRIKTSRLAQVYHSYSKDRRIRNYVYSKTMNV